MYDGIAEKLARGDTVILDGGTGTDIQRRGGPMASLTRGGTASWSSRRTHWRAVTPEVAV